MAGGIEQAGSRRSQIETAPNEPVKRFTHLDSGIVIVATHPNDISVLKKSSRVTPLQKKPR